MHTYPISIESGALVVVEVVVVVVIVVVVVVIVLVVVVMANPTIQEGRYERVETTTLYLSTTPQCNGTK